MLHLLLFWHIALWYLQTPNTEDLWINELLTNVFVFLLATTMLYLGHVYVIPVVFIQFGETAVSLMKVHVFFSQIIEVPLALY